MKTKISYIALLCLLLPVAGVSAQSPTPAKDELGKWGYQKDEQWVIEPRYETAFSFTDGLAGVRLNRKCGFIDLYGENVIPLRYENIWPFSEGVAAVKLNGKWGFIDKKGANVVSYKYDEITPFSNGLAGVKMNGKWGFINPEGKTVIPFKYDNVKSFSEGLSTVQRGQTWGFIDVHDNWYDSKGDYIPTFSDYAKLYVERRMNAWQKKGKYEKTVDWQSRVSEQNRKTKITELTQEAEKKYLQELGRVAQPMLRIGGYDADNETFLVKDKRFGELLVPVSVADAPGFEQSFYRMGQSVRYFVEDDKLALAEVTFTAPDGKTFQYSNEASLTYFKKNFDYRFAPIEIDTSVVSRKQRGRQTIGQQAGKSDVDINIPQTRTDNEKTFAVIIANENYKYEESVPFARTDGDSFSQYCSRTLGLPEDHIHFCADATLNEMRKEIGWLRDIGEAFGGEAKVIVYYSGHGIPSEDGNSSYLLPVDGYGKDTETGYDLARLYDQLSGLPVQSVTMFLDACFSGAKREGDMLTAGAHGVAIKSETTPLSGGNIVVFTASQGDETAWMYTKMGHGLFTYFLLKKLQDSKGNASLGELADYVTRQVKQTSIVTNQKSQTPTVTFSPMAAESWRKMKLR